MENIDLITTLELGVFSIFANHEIPTLMLNIGLALITILIPVVLFIFSIEKDSLFAWDKIVILDKVINAKGTLIAIGFIFVPLFFWSENGSIYTKILIFLSFLGGCIFIINVLIESYKWIKTLEKDEFEFNFRTKLRNEYLEETTNPLEKEKVWSLTWNIAIPNILFERNLIQKFISSLDNLFEEKQIEILTRNLHKFHKHIELRNLNDWVIYSDLYSKLLEWHYKIYQISEDSADWHLMEAKTTIHRLIESLISSGLQKGTAYLLFNKLDNHLQNKNEPYTKHLLQSSVCKKIFEEINKSNQDFEIWDHYFPENWKIKEDIEKNEISKVWFEEFMKWAYPRIATPEKEFDEALHQVITELFPNTDPIIWSKILSLAIFISMDKDAKSIVEHEQNFGLFGRVKIIPSTNDQDAALDEMTSEEEKNTYKLAKLLFKKRLTKEVTTKLVNDFSELQLEPDSIEEIRRKKYLDIAEKLSRD